MKTYEKKINENKIKPKLINIRVTDPELLDFLSNLKARKVSVSELTREMWRDSPDFSAWKKQLAEQKNNNEKN